MLADVDVEMRRGVTFIVGQNGVGKTTLFRVLLGTLAPTSGHAEIAGTVVDRRSRDGLVGRVGFLPQAFTAPAHMRASDFVAYVAWLRGLPKRTLSGAAMSALDLVGLADRAEDKLGTLSGGMLRRVGVAQALVHDPEILLLDEPTVGLDPTARVVFRQLVERLATERTVLTSTHLLEDVALTGGTLVALHEGHVAFHGPTATLVEQSAGPVPPGMSALEYSFARLVSGDLGEGQKTSGTGEPTGATAGPAVDTGEQPWTT